MKKLIYTKSTYLYIDATKHPNAVLRFTKHIDYELEIRRFPVERHHNPNHPIVQYNPPAKYLVYHRGSKLLYWTNTVLESWGDLTDIFVAISKYKEQILL